MQKAVFQLHLFAAILWSFVRMFALVVIGAVWRWAPGLAICVWILLAIVLVWRFHLTPMFFASQQPSTTVSTTPDLHAQISFWESQLKKQPTDRDILQNLSQLYAADGNQEKAQQYATATQQVDPNFK